MDITEDKYILEESSEKNIVNISDEIEFNLTLKDNPYEPTGGQVKGRITDNQGIPIKNALIILKTIYIENVNKALTSDNGEYTLSNIPPNTSYSLIISAEGMRLKESEQFTVTSMGSITRNFSLEPDATLNLSTIAGDVFDFTSKEPLNDCVVLLFKIESDDTRTLKSQVHTNKFGQFVLREIPNGNYFIIFSIFAFISVYINVEISNQSKIIPMTVNMIPEPEISKNIISGIISDSNSAPVVDATVLLYKKVNNTRQLISTTTTNDDGVYIFSNLEKGTYEVVSSEVTLKNTIIN